MDSRPSLNKLTQALERVQTTHDKVIICLGLFETVGLDASPASIANFLALPPTLVESTLASLEEEGLVGHDPAP